MTLDEDLVAEGPVTQDVDPSIPAGMPRKRLAAGALIRDEAGRILMVQPTYRTGWDVPGGVVDENEAPLDGCRRELREELGVDLPVGRLLVVDWVPQRGLWHDAVLFLFDAGVVSAEQIRAFRLPEDEIASIAFAELAEIAEHVRPSKVRRLTAALAAAEDGITRYLQFGREPDAR